MSIKPAPLVITERTASEKKVSGKNLAIICSQRGMLEIAKKVPPKNIIGKTVRLPITGTASVVFARPEIVKHAERDKDRTLNDRDDETMDHVGSHEMDRAHRRREEALQHTFFFVLRKDKGDGKYRHLHH